MKYFKLLCVPLLIGMFFACDGKPHFDKNGKLSPRQINEMERDFYLLHPGMTKTEVQKTTGVPHNSDNEIVWCFSAVDEYSQDFKWKHFMKNSYGIFLVFDESGKLATNIYKNTESDPWEALETAYHSSKNDPRIIKLLGSKP